MKFLKTLGNLVMRALDPKDELSSKRLILFMAASFFWLFCLAMLATGIVSMFTVTKGNIDVLKLVFALFEGIRENNMVVILGCLGLITGQNIGDYLIKKAQSTPAPVTVEEGGEATIVQNADTIEPASDVNVTNADTINTENVNK